jgi:hypothetical protein
MKQNMTQSEDYRKYLEEKFTGINTIMKLNFDIIHSKLEEINLQTTKTNSRVTHLEEEVEIHPIECKYGKIYDDLNFVVRHPKLFIAGMVVIILLTLATFIDTNPLKIFSHLQIPPKIEMTK